MEKNLFWSGKYPTDMSIELSEYLFELKNIIINYCSNQLSNANYRS